MSGWMISGYSEVRELGAGAQGRVVLARHDESGAPVAIKYLNRSADETQREQLRHEARMLERVDNAHIARFHRLVEGPDGVAIVMEAVDGVSLKELLAREGAFGPEASLAVLKGSLLGLAAAHALGVVHRDYKPANVVVPADGLSRLVDFGIATPAGAEAGGAGTPYYMAPEQWDRHIATPATDVYAATCVFVECAGGHRPYTGGRAALMLAHRTAEIPVETVPEPLRPLVVRGMAKAPEDRPAGAAAFVEELEAVAVQAYGPDWEHRGVRALAGAVAALAALFPLAAWLAPGAAAPGTADAFAHGAGETAAHGASEAAAHGASETAAHGASETAAHGAGEAAAHGASEAAAHGAGETVAHAAGDAAVQSAGQGAAAAGKAAAAGGMKTALAIGAAACGTAVVVGAGTVIAMQGGDDAGRTRAEASASPSRTATVASVTQCGQTGPSGETVQGTPGQEQVEIPAPVVMPDDAAVYYVGEEYLIGPANSPCGGSIGASSGLNRIGDPMTAGGVFQSWNGSVGMIGSLFCRYFPDTPQAAQEREYNPSCDTGQDMRRDLPTGGTVVRAAMRSSAQMGTEPPPSPYVVASLAVRTGDSGGFKVIDCVMPWDRRNICDASLTYWFVRATKGTNVTDETLTNVAEAISKFVTDSRR